MNTPSSTNSNPVNQSSNDNVVKWLVPIGRSGWAIAAGYAGLLSCLCAPAPLAVIFGIFALRDLKKHPQKTGKGRAVFGICMGVLFTAIGTALLIKQGVLPQTY